MIRPAMISITSVQALLMKARRQEIHMEYRQTAKGAGGARSATGARGLDWRRRTGDHGVAPTCAGLDAATGNSPNTGCSGSTSIQHIAPTRNRTPIKSSGRFQLLNH